MASLCVYLLISSGSSLLPAEPAPQFLLFSLRLFFFFFPVNKKNYFFWRELDSTEPTSLTVHRTEKNCQETATEDFLVTNIFPQSINRIKYFSGLKIFWEK